MIGLAGAEAVLESGGSYVWVSKETNSTIKTLGIAF